jgi:hypothetical protein
MVLDAAGVSVIPSAGAFTSVVCTRLPIVGEAISGSFVNAGFPQANMKTGIKSIKINKRRFLFFMREYPPSLLKIIMHQVDLSKILPKKPNDMRIK